MGHSLGGLLALAYAMERQSVFKTVILSAPALGLSQKPFFLKVFFGRLFSYILPKKGINSKLDITGISRDAKVVQEYKEDPLNHDQVSLYTARVVLNLQKYFAKKGCTCAMPVLLVHGTDDRLTSCSASKRFMRHLEGDNHRIITIDGAFHERTPYPI